MTTTQNPVHCNKCNITSYQVKLLGDLKSMVANDLYVKLKDDVDGFLHVAKKINQPVCYLHFESREKAAEFYNENEEDGFSCGDLFFVVHPSNANITYNKPIPAQTSSYKRKLLESRDALDQEMQKKEFLIDKLKREVANMKQKRISINDIITSI